MNNGMTFTDLPHADTIPDGTAFAVEMGDGSGTKHVKHEDVINAVADALALGNPAELETVAKDNFVNAINEIKRKTDSATGGAAIRVTTTDPALFGRTVTVTDGKTALQGSFSFIGECMITGILMNGDLTVSAASEEGATAETTVTVTVYATYNAELDTRKEYNRIVVATNETALYGAIVTVSNGTDSATGTLSSEGTVTVRIPFTGQVNVSASDGTNTAIATVAIPEGTESMAYDVELKLYHLTVTTMEPKLDGKVVTLVSRDHARTGTFAGGSADFTFDSSFLGECTISASADGKKANTKITVLASVYTYSAALSLTVTYTAVLDFSKSAPDKIITYEDDAAGMEKNYAKWREKDIFKDLQNCVLKDGKVLYYLNPDDVTKQVNGENADITTLGNDVMLEIPYRLGYKIEWADTGKTKLKVSVTNHPNDPTFEYDAFSLDSYNDCDRIYIGAYKAHCSNGNAYSSSGKEVTVSQTIDTFRTWCRARGKGYEQRTYGSVKLYQCLYIISHGTLDSQQAVSTGHVQTDSFAATGGANKYGFDCEVIKTDNPTYTTDMGHQARCLGLEDPWGNYYEFVEGLVTDADMNVLTCDIAKNFKTNGEGYTSNGNSGVASRLYGFLKLPQGGNKVGFACLDASGSDSTYFADHTNLYESRHTVYGKYWKSGTSAGVFSLYVNYGPSESNYSTACRLMFLHKEEKATS